MIIAGTVADRGAAIAADLARRQLQERWPCGLRIRAGETGFPPRENKLRAGGIGRSAQGNQLQASDLPGTLWGYTAEDFSRLPGVAAAGFPGDGGILAALWDMAAAGPVGLAADLRKIPLRQETVEICEMLDLNPYRLDAAGSVLMSAFGGQTLLQALAAMGIPAVVIGCTTGNKAKILHSGETTSYLDWPAEDEWKRWNRERGGDTETSPGR